MSIGKIELVEQIASKVSCGKEKVNQVITALFDTITTEVNENGNRVTIKNFGSFSKRTKEGTVRHIKTGKPIHYSTTRISFKCSPTLKK